MSLPPEPIRLPFLVTLAGSLVLVMLLWNTPVLLPLKWLVVLFHELSHAVAAWSTGGRVISLNITHSQGGVCLVAGGNRTITLLAGYPGSFVCGLMVLTAVRRGFHTGFVLGALGVVLLAAAVWMVRPLTGFGFAFALVAGAGLIAAGARGPTPLRAGLLTIIGSTSCAYALIDILQDVFYGRSAVSDATLLAAHTGIPFWFWGIAWYALTLAALGFAARRLRRARRNIVDT